jgi:hypothetical protein
LKIHDLTKTINHINFDVVVVVTEFRVGGDKSDVAGYGIIPGSFFLLRPPVKSLLSSAYVMNVSHVIKIPADSDKCCIHDHICCLLVFVHGAVSPRI